MKISNAPHRRTILKGIVGMITSSSLLGSAKAQSSGPSVTLEDQEIEDDEIAIKEVVIDEPVRYRLLGPNSETWVSGDWEGDQTFENLTLQLDRPATESGRVRFSLYPSGGGSSIASDTAYITVKGEYTDGMAITKVESDPKAGFNYPYFLFVPPTSGDWDDQTPLLVEPNNTGTSTDDFSKHEERARNLIEGGTARQLSEKLGVPLLVPVFPRPRSQPVDWHHYVHQLDRETLQISEGDLERVDLQLLDMVEHAQDKLAAESYPVREKIMLNGFSASGNFADRFTVLHPERVLSVTAGGLNGMALLPLEEAKGQTLKYHVGISDVEELIGRSVNLDALDEVNQFLYMGAEDSGDTIGYNDAWTSDELEQTALDVYGEDMIEDRFPFCQQAYEEVGVEAQFQIYQEAGHSPRDAMDDLVEFHRRSMKGDDVSGLGESIQSKAEMDVETKEIAVGESIEFSGANSEFPAQDILRYIWEFGDGESEVGKTVTHSYSTPGEYPVTFEIIGVDGAVQTNQTTITVSTSGGSTTERPEQTTNEGDDTSTTVQATTETEVEKGNPTTRQTITETTGESTTTESPGFGVISALASFGGISYILKNKFPREGENQ